MKTLKKFFLTFFLLSSFSVFATAETNYNAYVAPNLAVGTNITADAFAQLLYGMLIYGDSFYNLDMGFQGRLFLDQEQFYPVTNDFSYSYYNDNLLMQKRQFLQRFLRQYSPYTVDTSSIPLQFIGPDNDYHTFYTSSLLPQLLQIIMKPEMQKNIEAIKMYSLASSPVQIYSVETNNYGNVEYTFLYSNSSGDNYEKMVDTLEFPTNTEEKIIREKVAEKMQELSATSQNAEIDLKMILQELLNGIKQNQEVTSEETKKLVEISQNFKTNSLQNIGQTLDNSFAVLTNELFNADPTDDRNLREVIDSGLKALLAQMKECCSYMSGGGGSPPGDDPSDTGGTNMCFWAEDWKNFVDGGYFPGDGEITSEQIMALYQSAGGGDAHASPQMQALVGLIYLNAAYSKRILRQSYFVSNRVDALEAEFDDQFSKDDLYKVIDRENTLNEEYDAKAEQLHDELFSIDAYKDDYKEFALQISNSEISTELSDEELRFYDGHGNYLSVDLPFASDGNVYRLGQKTRPIITVLCQCSMFFLLVLLISKTVISSIKLFSVVDWVNGADS